MQTGMMHPLPSGMMHPLPSSSAFLSESGKGREERVVVENPVLKTWPSTAQDRRREPVGGWAPPPSQASLGHQGLQWGPDEGRPPDEGFFLGFPQDQRTWKQASESTSALGYSLSLTSRFWRKERSTEEWADAPCGGLCS